MNKITLNYTKKTSIEQKIEVLMKIFQFCTRVLVF